MPTDPPPVALTDSEFRARAQAVLERLEATIDAWLEHDVIDIDAQRTGGLMELALPDGSKIIVNTQPPLHELWIAARSGGFHFRFDGSRWLDTRNGREFFETLSICASEQAGTPLLFTA